MKLIIFKCDWCGHEERVSEDTVPTGWPAREGIIPTAFRNPRDDVKGFLPGHARLLFCKDACNQAHKQAEEAARRAAEAAWLGAYNERRT